MIISGDPANWSPEIKAQFADVINNPWTATDAEKAEFDTFLIQAWQQTLKAGGVANVDSFSGLEKYVNQDPTLWPPEVQAQFYDFLNAIIDYVQKQPVLPNETPAEQLAHLVNLPFALHELIRTDKANNLVPPHSEAVWYGTGTDLSPRAGFCQIIGICGMVRSEPIILRKPS